MSFTELTQAEFDRELRITEAPEKVLAYYLRDGRSIEELLDLGANEWDLYEATLLNNIEKQRGEESAVLNIQENLPPNEVLLFFKKLYRRLRN
jgi:hypothetical protein